MNIGKKNYEKSYSIVKAELEIFKGFRNRFLKHTETIAILFSLKIPRYL